MKSHRHTSRFSSVLRGAAAAALATALCVPGVLAGTEEPEFTHSKHPAQTVVDQEFSLESGGWLRIDVDDMDVYIKKNDGAKSRVQVFAAASSKEKALEYFEEHTGFELEEKDNELVMSSRSPSSFWGNATRGFRGVHVWTVVSVPASFNAEIKTEDGDLRVDDLNGEMTIRTSDGDIDARNLRGPSILVKTSDGDVLATSLAADDDLRISTSDGDIVADRFHAKRISVGTSDGDIRIENMEGDDIDIQSSDGDISAEVSGGALKADCSDGDIQITLLDAMALDLRSRDGDIDIVIPQTAHVDIEIKGDNVSLKGGALNNGNVSRRSIEGSLNNGGPLVRAKSSDGRIVITLQ